MSLEVIKGIPIPKGRRRYFGHRKDILEALLRMEIGDAYHEKIDNKHCYEVARELGVTIRTGKLEDGSGWLVWLVSKTRSRSK